MIYVHCLTHIFQTTSPLRMKSLENVLNSITELFEEESNQTEFTCESYAICKSGDLQFSRIWAVRIVQPTS
ncbi:unnamed protein product [Brassica rapa]|uniref:Uncharacterized protein n=1 Tax=Brassica campestris TaxID=3711 RepID=A0A8D9HM36_BRACM|nr:unnamed protein product [Brassica rapa]